MPITPHEDCYRVHKNDKCRLCPHPKIEERVRIHSPASGYVAFVSQFWCSVGCHEEGYVDEAVHDVQ